jgi:hypothetical protein
LQQAACRSVSSDNLMVRKSSFLLRAVYN